MFKVLLPTMCVLACAGWAIQAQEQEKQSSPPAKATPPVAPEQATSERDVVSKAIEEYTAAYNKQDPRAVAEFWAPEGISQDGDTGARIEGRQALQKHFETYFKENPQNRLSIRIEHVRRIKPDVLTLEGVATITSPDDDPDENTFSAILVKQNDRWFIDMAKETGRTSPSSPRDALQNLDWMVGTWVDVTPGVEVETNCRWNEDRTFLIRQYSVVYDQEDAISGTQVIGWDPRSNTIRSWTFGSDGSFGEGTWAQSSSEWRVRYSHVRADGSTLSGMQVITKNDENNITVQLIGREVDGEPMPATVPVKCMRKTETDALNGVPPEVPPVKDAQTDDKK